MIEALLAALLCCPAQAQQTFEVKRGDIQVVARVRGTVVAADIIRLKSQIEGRMEELGASTFTWITGNKPLGYLANREMAAILDSHTTTNKNVVEDRWRKVYQPTPIRCPADCYVLRVYAKNKEWLKPRSLMFEAAQKLQLVGRVRPEDAPWIRDEQVVELWAVKDPRRKLKLRVSKYVLDIQGEKVSPGASFTIDLSPKKYFEPGTEWEGIIIPVAKKDVLLVPTQALLEHEGATYMAVRVSTGITTETLTEITAGIESKRSALILNDAQLRDARRHRPGLDAGALQNRIREEEERRRDDTADFPPAEDSAPREAPRAYKQPKDKAGTLPDPDATYSEGPYGQ